MLDKNDITVNVGDYVECQFYENSNIMCFGRILDVAGFRSARVLYASEILRPKEHSFPLQ